MILKLLRNTGEACPDVPLLLTANANPSSSTGYSYAWYRNGTAIAGATGQYYTASTGGSYTVKISNSCSNITTNAVNIASKNSLGPLTNISPSPQAFYFYNTAPTSFTATAADATVYSWTLSQPTAGALANATTSSPTVTWNADFVGDVILTVTVYGCGGPYSKSITIKILPIAGTSYKGLANYDAYTYKFINYVKETDVRLANLTTTAAVDAASIGQKNVTISYYDGLGGVAQRVQQQASPNGKDIIQNIYTDEFGRAAFKLQSYPGTTTDASYKPYAILDQANFYYAPSTSNVAATSFPRAETIFEPSPVNRVAEQGYPGDTWQIAGTPGTSSAGHTSKIDFSANNSIAFSSDPVNGMQVRIYSVTIGTAGERTLVNSGFYAAGALAVSIIKDENWVSGREGTIEEYKDRDGHIVLRRNYVNVNNVLTMLSTYYVYDDFGYLCFVLTPKADPDNMLMTADNYNYNCYQYWYDAKGRMFRRKMPGKGWDFILYNKIDKIGMTQDANQRNKPNQEWTFTKYDVLGRVAMTGIMVYGAGAESNPTDPNNAFYLAIQGAYNNTTSPLWEARDNSTSTGYDNLSDPLGGSYTRYSLNFYDNYSAPAGFIPTTFSTSGGNVNTRGLTTISYASILGSSVMMFSGALYDPFWRLSQEYRQHYLGGILDNRQYDLVTNSYNFDNSINSVTRQHFTIPGGTSAAVTIANNYFYDLIGRTKQLKKSLNSGTPFIYSQWDYNEIGQAIRKRLHSTNGGASFLQDIDYAYNERGWLKKINDPSTMPMPTSKYFAEQLYYADGPTSAQKAYNGNISSLSWKTTTGLGTTYTPAIQSFDYTYDKLNRLTQANYTTSTAPGRFNETVSYDGVGNILTLYRNGNAGQIDRLAYHYSNSEQSSRLAYVFDDAPYSGGLVTGTTNYTWDVNGNQVYDDKKQTTVTYNILNLPSNVTKYGVTDQLNFVYAADGKKLRKTFGVTARDYDDGIEYYNNSIETIQMEEGRYVPSGAYYEYYLKDHIGNTRVTVRTDGLAYQVQDYYAFGMDMPSGNSSATSPDNRYKFNGKENETELALAQYDYGARFYDPVIARWATMDPLTEFMRPQSPYNYAFNNPLRFTDPTGMVGEDTLYVRQDTLQQVNVVSTPLKQSFASQAFWLIVDNAPFVGSSKQIYTGLRDGNYLEAGLGVVFLTVDIFTAGEGGEALRVAERAGEAVVKDVLEVAAKEEVEHVAEKSLSETLAKDATETLHGNSAGGSGAQHAYDIIDTHTKEIVKTGISGGKEVGGLSARAEKQVRAWNKANPGRYVSKITHRIPAGNGSRKAILNYEKARATALRASGHLTDITKHVRP